MKTAFTLTPAQLQKLRRAPFPSTGNRIKVAIDLVGCTQTALAEVTGMPIPYVSDVARGRYADTTVANAIRFARAFGCDVEDLFQPREVAAS